MATTALDLNPELGGRRWYVGGLFNKINGTTDDSIEGGAVQNLAYFDGSQWKKLEGKGPNGPVYVIKMDTKFNLIVGGKFTTVNDVPTGPVARYNSKDGKWESIVGSGTFSTGSRVHAIATDCFPQEKSTANAKNQLTGTRCDVYFGGYFNITGDVTCQNVARWQQTSNTEGKLLNLGTHGIKGTVYALYKKSLLTLTGASDTYLWVGGDLKVAGGPKYFARFEKIFDAGEETLVNLDGEGEDAITGVVRKFRYVNKYLAGQTDRLFLAGNFQVASKKCRNICEYNHKNKEFVALNGADTFTDGEGYDVALNSEDVYVGGTFTKPIKYVSFLPNEKEAWDGVHASQTANFDFPVHTMDVCSKYSKSCQAGSVAVGNMDGRIKFYDSENGKFEYFGTSQRPINQTTSDDVMLGAIYSYAAAGHLQVTFVVLAIVSALAMIL
eukprot:CAMPEP_0117419380 /NCGR_PEP_ID=MMETSP0758-20121206/952_1 /TAXON_ID=63605 /ORGANISM="Percolomonas cosmopolitus, Strain AE-1 (ATCC 50343)" /LENGTH=439 /DNA_ID=CAMNT_0005200407 /DNA_START=56 /DNA_END=1375 /DNA_ORIENTATION=+